MKGSAPPRTGQLDVLLTPGNGPRSLHELDLPPRLEILVAAPHPDDFDAIGLALRHLQGQGHALHVAVLTTGASGVDEGFAGAFGEAARAGLREDEQRASCDFFGLPSQRLEFLRLWGARCRRGRSGRRSRRRAGAAACMDGRPPRRPGLHAAWQ